MQVDSIGSRSASDLNSILRASVKRGGFSGEEKGEGAWVGEVGRRAEFILTLRVRIQLHEGNAVAIYKFTDPEGNDLTWFAGRDMDFAEGSTYRIKATVKKHGEFKGRKQTVIIRLKKLGQEYEPYHPNEETGNAWDAI